MQRHLIITILLLIFASSITSQNLYFDIGLGMGQGKTQLDGNNVSNLIIGSVDEACVDLGIKLGIGPIANTPIYIVGVLSGIGHRFYDTNAYIQFNSYILGGGIVFYPVPLIQLGVSAGYSFVNNMSDLPIAFYDSKSGYGGDISIALDLGGKSHGCLIGAKYTMTKNTLEVSGAEQESSLLSIFVRYAFRNK